MRKVYERVAAIKAKLASSFPRSHVLSNGSHSRGMVIAFPGNVDILALAPPKWVTWGDRLDCPT
jgi:hypothetical protein